MSLKGSQRKHQRAWNFHRKSVIILTNEYQGKWYPDTKTSLKIISTDKVKKKKQINKMTYHKTHADCTCLE